MKISLRLLFLGAIFSICALTQSCVGVVHYTKMDLQSKINNPSILNMRNYGIRHIGLYKQAEKLIRNHLFKNEGEEYGYYVLKYHTTRTSNILPACLHSGLLYILPLFAVPTHLVDFDLKADLYLFDSQGNLVKKYESSDSFRQVAGLYYGHNPQRKMERKYSELYDGLFRKANQEAEHINDILLKSGPISDKNRKQAKTNIEMFFKKDGKK